VVEVVQVEVTAEMRLPIQLVVAVLEVGTAVVAVLVYMLLLVILVQLELFGQVDQAHQGHFQVMPLM
jgi:hypothetical protein